MKLLSASNLKRKRRFYQWIAVQSNTQTERGESEIRRSVKRDAVERNRAGGVLPRQRSIRFSNIRSRQAILPAGPSDWNHAMRMQLNSGSPHHHTQTRNKKGKPRHEEPKHHYERC